MKYLLLLIGLLCYIAGLRLYFMKDDEQEKKSKWLIISGGLLVITGYCCFMNCIIPGIIFSIIFILLNVANYHDNASYIFCTLILIAIMLTSAFLGRNLPSVTLDNGVIEMSGKYGGNFNVSEMQSIDTVSVYPRVVSRRGGNNGRIIHYGNFDLSKENKLGKLCIYLNNPPYIKIRMNDNSLFIFNFKEPEQTVEFYNQLKNLN